MPRDPSERSLIRYSTDAMWSEGPSTPPTARSDRARTNCSSESSAMSTAGIASRCERSTKSSVSAGAGINRNRAEPWNSGVVTAIRPSRRSALSTTEDQ